MDGVRRFRLQLRQTSPQTPILVARLDEEIGDAFGQLAIEGERDLAVGAGKALGGELAADQLHLGSLNRFVALVQHLDRGGEAGNEGDAQRAGVR